MPLCKKIINSPLEPNDISCSGCIIVGQVSVSTRVNSTLGTLATACLAAGVDRNWFLPDGADLFKVSSQLPTPCLPSVGTLI